MTSRTAARRMPDGMRMNGARKRAGWSPHSTSRVPSRAPRPMPSEFVTATSGHSPSNDARRGSSLQAPMALSRPAVFGAVIKWCGLACCLRDGVNCSAVVTTKRQGHHRGVTTFHPWGARDDLPPDCSSHETSTWTYIAGARPGGEALIIDPVDRLTDMYLEMLGQLEPAARSAPSIPTRTPITSPLWGRCATARVA